MQKLSRPEDDLRDPAPVHRHAQVGEEVDLRDRHAYAASHLAGTIAIEMSDSFSTYLGWLIPWGTPVTLLGRAADVAEAQRQMARIGIDRPAGRAAAAQDGASYRVVKWPDLAEEHLDSVGDVPASINYRDVLAPVLTHVVAGVDLSAVFPGHRFTSVG